MSKRIKNKVMFLAEDIGCKIFYQDTDSTHIRYADIPKLSKMSEEDYGCKLIGSDLIQFHSDFDDNNKAYS